MDGAVAEIVDKLKNLNIFDDTMIIITADHGEELNTGAGKIGHGKNISDNEFRIPFIIYKNGLIPKRHVNRLTRSIDILPTILEFIEIKMDSRIDGMSFKRAIFGQKLLKIFL